MCCFERFSSLVFPPMFTVLCSFHGNKSKTVNSIQFTPTGEKINHSNLHLLPLILSYQRNEIYPNASCPEHINYTETN